MTGLALHADHRSGLTLAAALAWFAAAVPASGLAPVALLYGVGRCRFARLDGDVLTLGDGAPAALADVFEARLFNEAAELRWLQDTMAGDERRGAAVLLREGETAADAWPVSLRLDNAYVLWGAGVERPPAGLAAGWSRLAAARIGHLDVPLGGIGHRGLVRLRSVEYVGPAGCGHGNSVVFDERLVALEAVPAGEEG